MTKAPLPSSWKYSLDFTDWKDGRFFHVFSSVGTQQTRKGSGFPAEASSISRKNIRVFGVDQGRQRDQGTVQRLSLLFGRFAEVFHTFSVVFSFSASFSASFPLFFAYFSCFCLFFSSSSSSSSSACSLPWVGSCDWTLHACRMSIKKVVRCIKTLEVSLGAV